MVYAPPRSDLDRDRKRRAFIRKLRADLIYLGADRYLVNSMNTSQLLEARSRRLRQLQESAPRGARWDG